MSRFLLIMLVALMISATVPHKGPDEGFAAVTANWSSPDMIDPFRDTEMSPDAEGLRLSPVVIVSQSGPNNKTQPPENQKGTGREIKKNREKPNDRERRIRQIFEEILSEIRKEKMLPPDTIYLKSGEEFQCTILERSDTHIKFSWHGIAASKERSEIERIESRTPESVEAELRERALAVATKVVDEGLVRHGREWLTPAEKKRRIETAGTLTVEDSPPPETNTSSTGIVLRKLRTEYLGPLTGPPTNPLTDIGITGTDLGVSFRYDDMLIFLFGDSKTTNKTLLHDDSIAWAPAAPLEEDTIPQLNWFENPFGQFLSLRVPGVNLKAWHVPLEGIPIGPKIYLFFNTDFSEATRRHSHSVLAHANGLAFESLELDHKVKSDKFLNISAFLEENICWIFGSGHYHKSPVYLAKVSPQELANRNTWKYFQGLKNGVPKFGSEEKSAVQLFPSDCVGELSVRKHPSLKLYLMTYNSSECSEPRGILLRTSTEPYGPWSDPIVIFNPDKFIDSSKDEGYNYFIHAKVSFADFDDGLSDPGREEEWGGEYGPYLVPEWFSSESPGEYAIVYTLSSWNPYQVHLMRTWLTTEETNE